MSRQGAILSHSIWEKLMPRPVPKSRLFNLHPEVIEATSLAVACANELESRWYTFTSSRIMLQGSLCFLRILSRFWCTLVGSETANIETASYWKEIMCTIDQHKTLFCIFHQVSHQSYGPYVRACHNPSQHLSSCGWSGLISTPNNAAEI